MTITPRSGNGSNIFEGVGSGVIYDPDGWVVTNRHVVCGAETLTVQLADGHRYPGRIHGLDTLTDLAIVKIDGQGLPAVDLGNSGMLKVGQHAIAIGSPLGTFTNSVTTGVVSALGRQIDVDDALWHRGPGGDRFATSSRRTRPSTRATAAARSSIPAARSSASTPPSPVMPRASASPSP